MQVSKPRAHRLVASSSVSTAQRPASENITAGNARDNLVGKRKSVSTAAKLTLDVSDQNPIVSIKIGRASCRERV